jgi:predicted flap endonuclease-1-like 5' DNA nuclease
MSAPCPRCGCDAHAGDRVAVAATGRATHYVDADVLACFNAAHEEAENRGAAEVELGHLLVVMLRSTTVTAQLADNGLDAEVLAAVVETGLSVVADDGRGYGRPPRTSEDLRVLLDITQRTAALHGTECVSLRHIVGTLLDPPVTLRQCARVSRWFWAARHYPPSGTRSSSARMEATSQQPEAGRDERNILLARLERQERLLEDVLSQLGQRGEVESKDEVVALQPVPPVADAATLASIEAEVKRARAAADDLADDDGQEPDPELEKLGVRRYFLSLDDDIVRAPSIGPRTAERLKPHGLTHVKHLLACDPERMSARLGVRHLTASRIAAWKNQARLVCTIPWLRGTHAQLLVGAGYASIEKILSSDRTAVCAAVMQFSTTREGQSILRAGPPPELDRIMRWIENSQQSEPQRGQWGRALAS